MKPNMKKLMAWLLGIALIGIGSAALLYNQAGVDFWNPDTYTGGSGTEYTGAIEDVMDFGGQSFDRIEVKTVSSPLDVVVVPGALRAEFKGTVRSTDKDYRPRLVKTASGGVLKLEVKHPKGLNLGMNVSDTRLTLFLPESYEKALVLESVSGTVSVSDLTLSEGTLETVSGEIRAKGLSMASGFIESVSGAIDIDGLSGRILGKTTSGNMRLGFDTLEDTVYLETISGNLTLKVPEDAAFTLKTQTLSGDLDCRFPLVLKAGKDENILADINGGGPMLELRSVSGNLRLE